MKTLAYIEGPKALENFEQFATTILRAPKPNLKDRKKPKPTTNRKPKKNDDD
jgi:hypothetical protein